MNDDDNIISLGSITGGKAKQEEPETPENTYVITDIDGFEWEETGFLIFTSAHCAVMRESAAGALPLLVVPLARVKAAEILEDGEELPFD